MSPLVLPAASPAPLFLPSPSVSEFHLGPLTIHVYALCILAGIVVAWVLSRRRFVARGGNPEQFENLAAVAVVCGIVGARLYHVLTDPELYFGAGRHPLHALFIWEGGLGIWGAVAGGAFGAWLMARHYRLRFAMVADAIAPALLLAQSIGRLGNWFNQELFGRPTSLPWALRIDPQFRPDGYGQYATFHPTFLYEIVWNLFALCLLMWAERRLRLRGGRTFWLYVALYTFGRFFIERLRIDHANTIAGLRLNDWTSIVVFAVAVASFVLLGRRRPGTDLAGSEAPATVQDAETARGAHTTGHGENPDD